MTSDHRLFDFVFISASCWVWIEFVSICSLSYCMFIRDRVWIEVYFNIRFVDCLNSSCFSFKLLSLVWPKVCFLFLALVRFIFSVHWTNFEFQLNSVRLNCRSSLVWHRINLASSSEDNNSVSAKNVARFHLLVNICRFWLELVFVL